MICRYIHKQHLLLPLLLFLLLHLSYDKEDLWKPRQPRRGMGTAGAGLRASIQPLCFSVIRRQVKLVYMQQWENKLKNSRLECRCISNQDYFSNNRRRRCSKANLHFVRIQMSLSCLHWRYSPGLEPAPPRSLFTPTTRPRENNHKER